MGFFSFLKAVMTFFFSLRPLVVRDLSLSEVSECLRGNTLRHRAAAWLPEGGYIISHTEKSPLKRTLETYFTVFIYFFTFCFSFMATGWKIKGSYEFCPFSRQKVDICPVSVWMTIGKALGFPTQLVSKCCLWFTRQKLNSH